jgi:hypothetical protein
VRCHCICSVFSQTLTQYLLEERRSQICWRRLFAKYDLTCIVAIQVGLQAGAEFVAARQAAEACNAQLVLGDRPIEVSLQRAWDALSWRRRLRLLYGLTQVSRSQPSCSSLRSDPSVRPSLMSVAVWAWTGPVDAPCHDCDLSIMGVRWRNCNICSHAGGLCKADHGLRCCSNRAHEVRHRSAAGHRSVSAIAD